MVQSPQLLPSTEPSSLLSKSWSGQWMVQRDGSIEERNVTCTLLKAFRSSADVFTSKLLVERVNERQTSAHGSQTLGFVLADYISNAGLLPCRFPLSSPRIRARTTIVRAWFTLSTLAPGNARLARGRLVIQLAGACLLSQIPKY